MVGISLYYGYDNLIHAGIRLYQKQAGIPDVKFMYKNWEVFEYVENHEYSINWESELCRIEYFVETGKHFILIAYADGGKISAEVYRVISHSTELRGEIEGGYTGCPHKEVISIMKELKKIADTDGYQYGCENDDLYYVSLEPFFGYMINIQRYPHEYRMYSPLRFSEIAYEMGIKLKPDDLTEDLTLQIAAEAAKRKHYLFK